MKRRKLSIVTLLILSLALILCTSISGTTARTYVARSGGQNCVGFAMHNTATTSIDLQFDNCAAAVNVCANIIELNELLKQQSINVVRWVSNKTIDYIGSYTSPINQYSETRVTSRNYYYDSNYNNIIEYSDSIGYHWMVQVSTDEWAEKFPNQPSRINPNGYNPADFPWNTPHIPNALPYNLPITYYKALVN